MNWTDLKNKIYYWDGSWRDIYVLQTNHTDWKKWVDYVNKNYRIAWFNGKADKIENQIDFSVVEEFWNGNHDLCSTAKVFIDKMQINAHFFVDTEMENDIDPRMHRTMNATNDPRRGTPKTSLAKPTTNPTSTISSINRESKKDNRK